MGHEPLIVGLQRHQDFSHEQWIVLVAMSLVKTVQSLPLLYFGLFKLQNSFRTKKLRIKYPVANLMKQFTLVIYARKLRLYSRSTSNFLVSMTLQS